LVNIWSLLFTAIVATIGYKAFRLYLARQGIKPGEFVRTHFIVELPPEARAIAQYGPIAAAALFGLALPDIMTGIGQWLVAIGVIGCIFVFWWGIPLVVYNLLATTEPISFTFRFSSIAFLLAFALSLSAHIHVIAFLYFLGITIIGGWYWYEHHPWLKMKLVHDRCKRFHDAAIPATAEEFIKEFKASYRETWGFDPLPDVADVALKLFLQNAPKLPTVPDIVDFQPVLSPGQDIRLQLEQTAASLTAFPEQTEAVKSGIILALDTYTGHITSAIASYADSVRDYQTPSVLTVAALDVIDNLPDLVGMLATAMPPDGPVRELYHQSIQQISRALLSSTAFEKGERITPTEYPQYAQS
jgi:hypothetical protein